MKAIFLACCAISLLLSSSARAERADSLKPVDIQSGNVMYDKVAQKAIATGHVTITRGTMVLDSDRAEVREAPEGYRTFILTAAPGKLATFREKRDGGPDLWSEGHAERIEYDERADVMKLFSKAMIRQLDGTNVTQQMDQAFISYDNRDGVLVGRNNPNGADAPSHGRGSMIFEPRRTLPAAAGSP